MARLEDLRQAFMPLVWTEKVKFIEAYRTLRYNDLNTIQEFDLSKKTKSTKTREAKAPREKALKKVSSSQKAALSPEQLSLLKQLGLA